MELFKLFGTIAISNSEANESINETTTKAKKLKDNLKTFGNDIANFGKKLLPLTLGVAGLVTQGVKYNAQMEDFSTNLTTLLGSSSQATKLLSDLKEMAATTPFETTDLISATQTMIGYGLSAQDAQKYLTVLGDISMGDSEKLQGLSLAFSQVQSTGKLTGQDLMQMINQGFNPLLYLSKMTGKSMAELKEEMGKGAISAQMVGDAFEYATQEGQPFYNAMENASQTINGRLSTLKDNFKTLIGTLTESLLPTFEKIVDKSTKIIEKFQNLSPAQQSLITNFALVAAAIAPVLIVVRKLISTFTGIGDKISLIQRRGRNLISSLGGITAPILLIVAVIGTLVGAFMHLWNTNENFRNNISTTWENIKNIFTGFINGIVEEFDKFGIDFGSIFETIKSIWEGFCNFLAPIFEVSFGLIANTFQFATDGILSVLQIFLSLFKGDWSGALEGVKNFISSAFEFIFNIFSTIFGKINEVTGGKLGEIVNNIWTKLTTAKDKVAEIIGNIKTTFSTVFGNIKTIVTNIFDGIKSKIESVMNSVKSVVSTAIDKVKSIFNFHWELPKLKLPHISVTGGEAPFGIGGAGSLPKFDIQWYKKAMDEPIMFTEPTLFSYNPITGMGKGAGEAGDEMMYGKANLMNDIENAMSKKDTLIFETLNSWFEQMYELFLQYFPEFSKTPVLDIDSTASALAIPMDRELRKLAIKKERGR